MDSIKYWFHKNSEKLSWFIIGFMTWQGLDELTKGQYGSAMLSFSIAFLNFILSRR